jgi:cyclic beta-1,2-glucan synthetase
VNNIKKGIMAPLSKDPIASEQALPPATAPALDLPTAGLPEKPSVSNAELQERAEALSRQWEMVPAGTEADGLSARLVSLKERLTEILRACRKTASLQELTPQLELLESTRMLESALIAGDETNAAFASLPHVRVDGDKALPRVFNRTEGYLSAAQGICHPNLSPRMCNRRRNATPSCSKRSRFCLKLSS